MKAGEILASIGVIALLAVWAWFWTGPELRWERSLYEPEASRGR